jgi:hypothetical protein
MDRTEPRQSFDQYPQTKYAKALIASIQTGNDKTITKAILQLIHDVLSEKTPPNIPSGPDKPIDIHTFKVGYKKDGKLAEPHFLEKIFETSEPAISLALYAETHSDAKDKQRANKFLLERSGKPQPSFVVFERSIGYKGINIPDTIREEDLTTGVFDQRSLLGLGSATRSKIVAGYLVLFLSTRDQSKHDKGVIFFGEKHTDIFTHFKYFIDHTPARYLLKRQITLVTFLSHVETKKPTKT